MLPIRNHLRNKYYAIFWQLTYNNAMDGIIINIKYNKKIYSETDFGPILNY